MGVATIIHVPEEETTVTNLSIRIHSFIMGLLHREEGQDLVEYAVLVGAIGITAAAILFFFLDGSLQTFADTIEGCLQFDGDACNLPG
jgi:hypothetical protein